MSELKYPKCHDCAMVDCGEMAKSYPECYIKISDAPRPAVKLFAKEMEKQLRANEDKGHWSKCTIGTLLAGITWNDENLRSAITRGNHEEIIRRAVNIANYAMMVAENEGKLES